MPANDPRIGAWAPDLEELAGTPLSGRGNDADAEAPDRFWRNVKGVVRQRERRPNAEFDNIAVFFLATSAWFEQAPAAAERNPMLNTGNFPLTEKIHGVNSVVAGLSIPYAGGPAGLLNALRAVHAASMPTVVYVPQQGGFSTLTWFPQGLANEDAQEVWHVAQTEPTPELITEAIGSVHTGRLLTPDQIVQDEQVWKDAAKGWAHERAEARIQSAVQLGLLGRFPPPYRIEIEQPGKDGRTDIEILEAIYDRPEVICHAVLELKVLREYGSTGNKVSDTQISVHLNDGVEQAYTYGQVRNFRECMLCCFDMRATNAGSDAVLAPLRAKADLLQVHLRHWFLYRSSEHYRACTVANELKVAKIPPDPH